MPAKRKGGVRQRLQQEDDESKTATQATAEHLNGSSLAAYLIFLWSWGIISPQMVQKLAFHAHTDVARVGRHASGGKDVRLLRAQSVHMLSPLQIFGPLRSAYRCMHTCTHGLLRQHTHANTLEPHSMQSAPPVDTVRLA